MTDKEFAALLLRTYENNVKNHENNPNIPVKHTSYRLFLPTVANAPYWIKKFSKAGLIKPNVMNNHGAVIPEDNVVVTLLKLRRIASGECDVNGNPVGTRKPRTKITYKFLGEKVRRSEIEFSRIVDLYDGKAEPETDFERFYLAFYKDFRNDHTPLVEVFANDEFVGMLALPKSQTIRTCRDEAVYFFYKSFLFGFVPVPEKESDFKGLRYKLDRIVDNSAFLRSYLPRVEIAKSLNSLSSRIKRK